MNPLVSIWRRAHSKRTACLVLCFLFALPVAVAQSAGPPAVLVQPFVVHGAGELSYLGPAAVDMLATRLAVPGKTAVVAAATAPQAGGVAEPHALADAARKRGARWALAGSFTVLGDRVSTDAKLVEAQSGKVVLSFHRAGTGQGAVIDHVEALAAAIRQQVFGIPSAVAKVSPAGAPAAPPAKAPAAGPAADRRHPEAVLQPRSAPAAVAGESAQETAAAGPPPVAWKSRQLEGRVVGLCAARHQGKTVLAVAFDDRLAAYEAAAGRLRKLAELPVSGLVAVTAADLDGDGDDELYLNRFDVLSKRPEGRVAVFSGASFSVREDRLSMWFARMRDPADGTEVLVAQRTGADRLLRPGIYRVEHAGAAVELAGRLPLDAAVDISAVVARAAGDGGFQAVRYHRGNLQVVSAAGKQVWQGVQRLAPSGVQVEAADPHEPGQTVSLDLPPRLAAVDLDGDGGDEILAVVNDDATGGVFGRLRVMKSGKIRCYKADELGLTALWETRPLARYITDLAVCDLDGNGGRQLVYAVVVRTASALSKAASYLVAHRLP